MESTHVLPGIPASPEEALQRLKDGNKRYREGRLKIADLTFQDWADRRKALEHQTPWAVIWGCMDSRVPPEIVFDCGLGELFVIRTAGQVSDRAALGSLEFAVSAVDKQGKPKYPIQVVMVLGHSVCGAASATIDSVDQPPKPDANMGSISALVEAIKPAYRWFKDDNAATPNAAQTGDARVTQVSMRNVEIQVETLKRNKILEAAGNRIAIVGAFHFLLDEKVAGDPAYNKSGEVMTDLPKYRIIAGHRPEDYVPKPK